MFNNQVSKSIKNTSTSEYDKAIPDFSKAIELEPNLAQPYFGRGVTYAALGKKAEAIADLERCIELSQEPGLTQQAEQLLEQLRTQ